MTAAGKAWKKVVADAVRDVWTADPTKRAQWRVELVFFYRTCRSDIDNGVKLVLDALENVVFENDREVMSLVVTKRVNYKEPGVEITLTRL